MKDLYERGVLIDRVTVAEELMKWGQLESVDGLAYLITLDEGLPEIAHLARTVMNECLLASAAPSEILDSHLSQIEGLRMPAKIAG